MAIITWIPDEVCKTDTAGFNNVPSCPICEKAFGSTVSERSDLYSGLPLSLSLSLRLSSNVFLACACKSLSPSLSRVFLSFSNGNGKFLADRRLSRWLAAFTSRSLRRSLARHCTEAPLAAFLELKAKFLQFEFPHFCRLGSQSFSACKLCPLPWDTCSGKWRSEFQKASGAALQRGSLFKFSNVQNVTVMWLWRMNWWGVV